MKFQPEDLDKINMSGEKGKEALACHCMTTLDNISATAFTNLGYNFDSAKKLLN